jgi:hypothetical protein
MLSVALQSVAMLNVVILCRGASTPVMENLNIVDKFKF